MSRTNELNKEIESRELTHEESGDWEYLDILRAELKARADLKKEVNNIVEETERKQKKYASKGSEDWWVDFTAEDWKKLLARIEGL